MNFLNIVVLNLLTWSILFTTCAQNNQLQENQKQLNQYLQVIHQKKNFSGEILIAKGENILFHEAVGLANREQNISLIKGSKYQIASISKTFTGTLIMIAEEENLLKTSDKASLYLQDLAPKFSEITIQQLLSHTSGLPHNEGIKDYWLIKSKLQQNQDQVITEINQLELLFQSGEKMSYSSPGYYLLAAILESVYQKDFQAILQEKILQPLDMTETDVANSLDIIPQMTNGYHFVTENRLVKAPYRNYSMLKGAGDMYASATDLLKWSNSFFKQTLLYDDTVFQPTKNAINAKGEKYGFGWFIGDGEMKKYYHGGGTWGFSSHLAIYPENEISIIILSNVSTLPVSAIALGIEKMVFHQPFEMPKIEEEVSEESVDLNLYPGEYQSKTSPMKLKVFKAENGLYVKLGGNPPFQIFPKGEHQFFGKKVEIEFTFKLIDGEIKELEGRRMGQVFNFEKL